jgi:hypothetical protein
MAGERLEPQILRKDLRFPTLAEAREILGGKLPSVFEKYDFPVPGIVLTENGPRVPVYPASGQGFSFPGNFFLDNYLHPKIEAIGGFVLNPFAMCGEFVRPEMFDDDRPLADLRKDWDKFNREVVDTVNYKLAIPRAGIILSLCEGVPVDDGMSSEMSYTATNTAIVVAVRSDFRGGENVATGTNPAVSIFAKEKYGGQYFESSLGDNAYKQAFLLMEDIINRRIARWEQTKS